MPDKDGWWKLLSARQPVEDGVKSGPDRRLLAVWAVTVVIGAMLVVGLGVWQHVRSQSPPCVAGLRVDGFEETYRWYDRVEDVSRTYWVGPSSGDPIQAFHLHQVELRASTSPGTYGGYSEVAVGYTPEGATPSVFVVVYRLPGISELHPYVLKRQLEDRGLSGAQRAAVRSGAATILLVQVLCH